jgi:hypothetical protein
MAAAMRTAMIRLGFSNPAAHAIVDDQGIDTIPELALLTDDEVENLCKVIRRPGGTINNPNAAAGQPAVIPNPGIPVTLRAENNLKLGCYLSQYNAKVSREVTPATLTLVSVRGVRSLKEWEGNQDDPSPPDGIINSKDWAKTMESIVEYLRGNLGVTKVPLSYVVRDDPDVPADADDPASGTVGSRYPNKQEEMIARAPFWSIVAGAAPGTYGASFLTDRERVWELISALTRDHECWSYVKPAQRARDGRAAYRALFDHYLGPNNVDNSATEAERKLTSTNYNGEKRRWNFERYVRVHVDQHQVLNNLKAYGYAGIDDRSKVRHLLDGIKDKSLDVIKAQVMSTPALRVDFDACVTIYKDYIKQTEPDPREANLSQLNQEGSGPGRGSGYSGGKRGGGGPHGSNGSVEDRYYTSKEYAKLTKQQKDSLRRIRSDRDDKPPKKARVSKAQTNKLDKMYKKIVQLSEVVGQKLRIDDDTDPASSDSEGDANNNRQHHALVRQKKKN